MPQTKHRFKRHRQLKSMKRSAASDPMFASEYYDQLSAGAKSKQLKLISEQNQKLLDSKILAAIKGTDDKKTGDESIFRVPQRIPNKKVAAMDCE
jgi:hypothetical protein